MSKLNKNLILAVTQDDDNLQMETTSENNAFKGIIVKKEAILNRKYCSENKRNRCLVFLKVSLPDS